jgi:glycerophosphoryl diester phosphodiesterase
MIELDVHLTKDGHLIILHDETVDRTTNGHGSVSEKTLDEVRQLDAGSWKSGAFKGIRIPTLKEALDVIPSDIWINVHIKGGRELGVAVATVLKKEDRLNQAFIACNMEAAEGAKGVTKEIMICNMERQSGGGDYVDLTIRLGSDFIQLYKTGANAQVADMVKKLKTQGIRINYCCTDDPEEIKKLFDLGVEFILVNHPAQALEIADSLGIERTNL